MLMQNRMRMALPKLMLMHVQLNRMRAVRADAMRPG
jgi:hypothetical protein